MRVSTFFVLVILVHLVLGCGGGGNDGKLTVGSIEGPGTVDEHSYGTFAVTASGDTGITYQWAVYPPSAGAFASPSSATTNFHAAGVSSDTPVEIKVVVSSNKSGPVLATCTVTVLDSLVTVGNLKDIDSLPLSLAAVLGDQYKFDYSGTPPEIEPGDILMGSEKGGYLRKVESVQDTGSSLIIYTSQATLEDAIVQGHLTALLDFNHHGSSQAQSTANPRSAAEVYDYPPLVVPLSGLELYSDEFITVEIPDGEVSFAPRIEVDMVFDSQKLTYFLTTASGSLDFNFDLLATGDGDFDIHQEKLVYVHSAAFKLGPFFGAVVFDFYAGVEINGNIQGHLATGFDYHNNLTLGAEYSERTWQAIGEQNPEFSERLSDGMAIGDAYLRGYIRPEVRVLLFNTSSTIITAEPYLEFTGTGQESPPCLIYDLTAGIKSNVFVFVDILSWELDNFSAVIFDWRELFFSGEIGDCNGQQEFPNCEEFTKYSGNPVLTYGETGEWDRYGTGRPCVVEVPPEFGGPRLFMYYSAHSGDQVHKIGMASTDDPEGLTGWVCHLAPVLEPDPGHWDGGELWSPWVIYDDGPEVIFSGKRFKMWYGGVGGWMGPGDIGYAESQDGINWVRYPGNPVILHAEQPWWDAFRIMHPCVIRLSDVYRIYYWGTVAASDHGVIGIADSPDGVHWTLHPDNPVFEPSPISQAWDSYGVGAPSVVTDGITMSMFYTGWGPMDPGTGLAWSNDGINWERCENPVLKRSYDLGDWDYGSLQGGMAILIDESFIRMWYSARDRNDIPWKQSHDAFGVAEGTIYTEMPPLQFAYTSDREGNFEIYLTDTAGTFEDKLTNDPGDDSSCDFSPDGSIIYFNTDRDGDHEIYALDMNSGAITNITHDSGTQYGCAVSPDGEWILTVQSWSVINKDIFRLRADGSMDRSEWINLTNTPGQYEHEMDWSPDGTKITFYRIDNTGNDGWIMDSSDGGNQQRIIAGPGDAHGPTYHPSGDFILYFSNKSSTIGLYYYSFASDSTYTYIDTNLDEGGGEFSPDGQYVIFHIGEIADIYYATFPELGPGEPIPLITGPGHDSWGIWRPGY
jgi:predicted GH43/DUF377 family glycosyl hydrolase